MSYPEWVNSAQEPEEERKWRREANLHLITKSFSLPSSQILTPCLRHVSSWQRGINPLLLLKTFTLANWCSRSHWAIVLFTFWMNPHEKCSCAAVQLCNCAVVWLFSCTVIQLCRCAIVHLCSCAELVMERMPRDNVHLWCCCFTFLAFLSSLKLFSKVVPFLLCLYVLFTFGITVHCTRKVHFLLQTENAQTMCISPTQCSTFSAFSSPCS